MVFQPSSRPWVEICPSTDRWMRGDRTGVVTQRRQRDGQTDYRVKLDISGESFWFPEDLIYKWL